MDEQTTLKFLKEVTQKLHDLKINVDGLRLDHIAYQTKDLQTYAKLKSELQKEADFIREAEVGKWLVAIYKLHKVIAFNDKSIEAVELLALKEGSITESRFQHIEYTVPDLHKFVASNLSVNWDITAIDRDEMPRVKADLGMGIEIKFNKTPILEEN